MCIPSRESVLVDFNQLDAGLLLADDNIPDLFIGVANQRPAEHRLTVLFDRMGVFLAKQDEQGLHIPVAVCLRHLEIILPSFFSGDTYCSAFQGAPPQDWHPQLLLALSYLQP